MNDEQPEVDDLGARIAAARVAAGLSKEAAAKRAGVTTTTLRRAEADLRVQQHKLAAIMTAVGMPAFPVRKDESGEYDTAPFSLPASVERGYTDTVAFTRAVSKLVPDLSQRATRLMLDASALFSAAGEAIYAKSGGDGDADEAAPIVRELRDYELDEAAYPADDDKK